MTTMSTLRDRRAHPRHGAGGATPSSSAYDAIDLRVTTRDAGEGSARLLHLIRLAAALLVLAMMAACASVPARHPLAHWVPSPNHNARSAQLIVLHQTEMKSAAAALLVLRTRNAQGRVSAHYLIGGDGRLYQLVAEQDRAWHAGDSRWGGLQDINSASIGIELDNDGQSPFPDAQIGALLRLLDDVTTRLRIPRHAIVAHGDIAPTRRRDPGVLFPWQRLADAGFGLWPGAAPAPAPDSFDPWLALRLIGYDLRDPAAAVRAFHRHYRGSEGDTWEPGDAAILHDLQRQLLAMPAPQPTRGPVPGVDSGSPTR